MKTINGNNGNKSLELLLASRNQTMICPVTGLSSTISIPAIPGHYLDFPCPLASIDVALQYSTHSYKELKELPSSILSALIFSTLQDFLVTGIPVIHLNAILQTLDNIILVKQFKLLASLHTRKGKALPTFRVESIELFMPSYVEYITLIGQLVEGTYWSENKEAQEGERTPVIFASTVQKKKMNLKQLDTFKTALKLHLSSLKDAGINPNLLALLTLLTKNDALRSTSSEVKQKVIAALRKIELPAAQSFANILEKTLATGVEEKDLGESVITSSLPEAPKRTLAEILASKNRKILTRAEASEVWDSEIKETSYLVDITEETPADFNAEGEGQDTKDSNLRTSSSEFSLEDDNEIEAFEEEENEDEF